MDRSMQVEIYGQRYTLKGRASEAYVRELAGYVDRKMREIAEVSNVNSPAKVAILASLNIADELFQQRTLLEQKEGVLKKAEQRVSSLIDTIEEQFEDLRIE